jgi:nucleotide-binding universal stress UspA family protein
MSAIATKEPVTFAGHHSVTSLKNILFATDFSAPSMKAFPYVTALAKKFGASVFACHVITPTSLVAASPQAASYVYEAEYNVATKELENILGSPELKGLNAQALLSSGILEDVLLDEINQNKIDLVIAGTHGRTGWRRLLLGSAVEAICRVATCPVLTVGPEAPGPEINFRHILVPTDLSEDSMRSLPLVVQLSGEYGASVTILHVLPEDTAGNPDAKALSEPVFANMVRIFQERLGSLKPEFVIESGKTVATVLKVAREKKADLIAMGIRGAFLPGFHSRLSVAYRVVAGAHCPVVTCR